MSGKNIQRIKAAGKRQATVRCPNCDELSDGFPCNNCGYGGKAPGQGDGNDHR